MTTKPRIAIVIGSTRPGRYADKAAGWMLKQTKARGDIEAELLDLRDHPLPFFDEKGPPMSTPSENPEALRWQKTLARYDGFVFVVAEYNSSITGVLKNALDQAYKEWGRKPFTAIGYGGAGAARAVEDLRKSRVRREWFRPQPPSILAAPISCRPPRWVQTGPSQTSRHTCLPPRSRLWMSSFGGPTRRWRRKPLKLHSDVTISWAEGVAGCPIMRPRSSAYARVQGPSYSQIGPSERYAASTQNCP